MLVCPIRYYQRPADEPEGPLTTEEVRRRPLVRRQPLALGTRQLFSPGEEEVDADDEGWPLVTLPLVQQFPSSVAQVRDMALGRRNMVHDTWRWFSSTVWSRYAGLHSLIRTSRLSAASGGGVHAYFMSPFCAVRTVQEVESVAWVAKTETVYESDGRCWEMPVRVVKAMCTFDPLEMR